MFIVRECRYVCGGRKGPDVFFPAKKLRNAPWEVVCKQADMILHTSLRYFCAWHPYLPYPTYNRTRKKTASCAKTFFRFLPPPWCWSALAPTMACGIRTPQVSALSSPPHWGGMIHALDLGRIQPEPFILHTTVLSLPVKNCTSPGQKRRFWFVSIKRPFHASDIEISVWTPTPTPEDEVWNILEASVTNNLPVGAIPHRPFMGEV